MKKVLLVIVLFSIGCKSKKQKFQPAADVVKKYFLSEFSDIEKIDTVYLMIDTLTAKKLEELQGMQYTIEGSMFKVRNESDIRYDYEKEMASVKVSKEDQDMIVNSYEHQKDSCYTIAKGLDSIRAIYYEIDPMLIVTKKNMERAIVSAKMFFDVNFNLIPQKSILPFISDDFSYKPKMELYKPFPDEAYSHFDEMGIVKYY